MIDLLRENESLALFTGILVFGLVVLLPSTHLALRGEIDAAQLVLFALLAMCVSDLAWYLAGRWIPSERLKKVAFVDSVVRRVGSLADPLGRLGLPLLFGSRFLYGTRIPTCIACGLARMRYGSYLVVNLVSAILWLALLFVLALTVGTTIDQFAGGARDARLVPTVLVLLALAIQLWIRRARARAHPAVTGSERATSVSVVIPAYNEEPFLEAAIASVRAQSVPAEVVVVENGSTDGTAAIARRRADRVVQTAEPAGYSRARNLGASAASGELLVFLDADSCMAPDALEVIAERVRPRTFGTVLGRASPPRLRYRVFFFFKNVGHRLRFYKGVLGGLLFCDAALFREIGGFDETMVIDELHDFSVRARRAGGRYRLITGTWASTSMRRFDQMGLWRAFRFWLRLRFRLPALRGFHSEVEAYPQFRRNVAALRPQVRHPREEVTPDTAAESLTRAPSADRPLERTR